MQTNNTRRFRQLRARVLREETVCYICGLVVDKTLTTPDPGSPEVDHVLPRSTHPHLMYDRSNLRLACRKCNRAKSASLEATVIRRSSTLK